MSPEELVDPCVHGRSAVSCWDCLTPESQEASESAWYSLSNILGFSFSYVSARDQAQQGKLIEILRPRPNGLRVLLPYSLFSQCVDLLYEEHLAVTDE